MEMNNTMTMSLLFYSNQRAKVQKSYREKFMHVDGIYCIVNFPNLHVQTSVVP